MDTSVDFNRVSIGHARTPGTDGRRVPSFSSDMDSQRPPVDSDASEYYADSHTKFARARTYSVGPGGALIGVKKAALINNESATRQRRLSHDEASEQPRRFYIDVESTLKLVLEQEDKDGDYQITVTDAGPRLFKLGSATSNGFKTYDIRGHYMLSNLLQELALARDYGRKRIVLDEARLTENPVSRLSRMIKHSFWHALTRRIDGGGIELICADPKAMNRTPRIYCPVGAPEIYEYYQAVARDKPALGLEVILLPEKPDDPEFVKSINNKPGILALQMRPKLNSAGEKIGLEGIPFVVPGARFNELYNWDSAFIALGLIVDGKVDLAKGTVDHFVFEIRHYGKILNGNRSYYLCRSQPPFLTDFALQVYANLDRSQDEEENIPWLKRTIRGAIKEYHAVWMSEPRLDLKTGLSRYRPVGLGIPPETEASHFTHILKPFADQNGLSVLEFSEGYNDGTIKCPELDEYFLHDRAVRESGRELKVIDYKQTFTDQFNADDTTYRFEKRCANLATVDLNALLYKYEFDIATAIKSIFDDELDLDDDFELTASPFPESSAEYCVKRKSLSTLQTSAEWFERAAGRKARMDQYLWDEQKGMYYDYDTKNEKPILYDSVTTYWPMWAGCASADQAKTMMNEALKKFEVVGGLVAGTEESRGKISLARPNRQWDYPYGWAPHQIMAWVGMQRYGYQETAQRLAYRWIYMMTTAFVDHNGVVPEKFDVVKLSHLVDAEYGNQGLDFKCVPREGFGWTSASYRIGLTFLNQNLTRAVALCTSPEVVFPESKVPGPPQPQKFKI